MNIYYDTMRIRFSQELESFEDVCVTLTTRNGETTQNYGKETERFYMIRIF